MPPDIAARGDRLAGGPLLTYSGGWLDRAGDRRADPAWVRQVFEAPGARVLPMWRDGCLVGEDGRRPLTLPAPAAGEVVEAAADVVLLGLDGGRGVFAVDLSAQDRERALAIAGATDVLDVRRLVADLPPAEAAVAAHARGILHWHRNQRYCGTCGEITESRNGGQLRACTSDGCGRLWFPRIEPAVITIVVAPGEPERCLLARHRGAAEGSYALVAGFVEVGESLEDAVRREVAEETGIQLAGVAYQASQAWPFPSGLMVGFRAVAATDTVAVDGEEVVEATWFTRAELTEMAGRGGGTGALFNVDSIEHHLVASWLYDKGL